MHAKVALPFVIQFEVEGAKEAAQVATRLVSEIGIPVDRRKGIERGPQCISECIMKLCGFKWILLLVEAPAYVMTH